MTLFGVNVRLCALDVNPYGPVSCLLSLIYRLSRFHLMYVGRSGTVQSAGQVGFRS